MKISTNYLRRYKQIAMLLWKYGRSDLVQQMGIDDEWDSDEGQKQAGDANPEQLADELEAMGPTFVKLG
jgi:predicted unusual protein kinase regulating ubiquinone biosynthesis (AarF/ABC1/UbiB family)